jgi:hypothetical protein
MSIERATIPGHKHVLDGELWRLIGTRDEAVYAQYDYRRQTPVSYNRTNVAFYFRLESNAREAKRGEDSLQHFVGTEWQEVTE